MPKKPNMTNVPAELRSRAEARLQQQKKRRAGVGGRESHADAQRMLHELQVHQVELDMQNVELQRAHEETETLLEKYTDLYDFAPVGYFTLDAQGRILEVNLTGATLLGVTRALLLRQTLPHFVAPASRPVFLSFLEQIFSGPGQRVGEVSLLKAGGQPFWANLHGTAASFDSGAKKCCRVAVSDITALKQAEVAQQRLDAIIVTNEKLRQEIVRRLTVEKALKDSERQQGQLLDEAHHMQAQLRHLSHQILQAQEEERKRISRELHDDITQTLVGINVQLETLTRAATLNPASFRRQIARTQRLVEQSVNIVHQFARELRPTSLDDLGLIATLHTFMKDFTERTGIRIHFVTFTSGRIAELDNTRSTILYRIAQEALTNVARHAHASVVEVALRKLPQALSLTIQDNGKAFDVTRVMRAKRYGHLGLLGMRERVEMVSGQFAIESTPGQGTTIRAQIPLIDSNGVMSP
jgi:PAS domain S-box-containing protein